MRRMWRLRCLRYERRGYRDVAECIAQYRPVHRFIAEYARRGFGQIAVVKCRHRAEISAHRALLQPRGKAQHVSLALELVSREIVFRQSRYRLAAELRDGLGQ